LRKIVSAHGLGGGAEEAEKFLTVY